MQKIRAKGEGMRNIKVIGMTGRSGSGKGYLCDKFLAFGIPSLDTDSIYRSLTSKGEKMKPCTRELCECFGEQVVAEDNSLDRKNLSEIVFRNREMLAILNEITHKYILGEVRARIAALSSAGCAAVIVDAPVLFESGFDIECDVNVLVRSSEEKRIKRIMLRDRITEEQAKRRLASQSPDSDIIEKVDFIIDNDGDEALTDRQIANVVDFVFNKVK